MAHKMDARRLLFLSNRANKMFEMMKQLDALIEQMDDVGHLVAARDLIEKRWESEVDFIDDFQQDIDAALTARFGE